MDRALASPLEELEAVDWYYALRQVPKHENGHLACANDAPFLTTLSETGEALERAQIPYGIMGGIASSVLGRPRSTSDIDVFLRPESAEPALDVLKSHGFETDKLDEKWIYKAYKRDVSVDVIFSTRYGVYFDREMHARARDGSYLGVPVRVLSPEDMLVIKAIACDEATPKHWYDALGIITRSELDWDYVLFRSLSGQRRVLSLLLYAQSIDYFVPERVVKALMRRISED